MGVQPFLLTKNQNQSGSIESNSIVFIKVQLSLITKLPNKRYSHTGI